MITYVAVGLLALLSMSIPVGIVLFLLGFGIDWFPRVMYRSSKLMTPLDWT